MAATSTNRFWPIAWLFLAIILVPFSLAYLLFDVNQFEVGVLFSLVGLLAWLVAYGAGWRPVTKDTFVLVRDALDNVTAHHKGSYLFIPIVTRVEAVLPTYPITFELPIEGIDTHTPGLAKISKITVRATCQILHPEMFYRKSRGYVDRIRQMEEAEKLKRTEVTLWRKLLEEVAHVYLDDTVRDVVWKWKLFLADPEVVRSLDYAPEKDGQPNLDGDPYSLSRNRKALGDQVKAAVRTRLEHNQLGFRVDPLVLESIEIDGEIIKRATADRNRELEKAAHDAAVKAEEVRVMGEAEAKVRAANLAGLLDVLINQMDIPHDDPLIADLVRASLYKEGELSWRRVIEKGPETNGAARPT